MKHITAFTLLLFVFLKVEAQEKIPFLDLDTIYEQLSDGSEPEDYNKNTELLNKISKNDSSYCDVLVSKSYYLLNATKYNEALNVIDEGLNLNCGDLDLSFYINQALIYTIKEDYDKADEVYNKALEIYPKNAELWMNRGRAYEKAKNLEAAINAYQTAIILKPTYAQAHLQLGNICYKQERITQALMCFNVYLTLIIDEENAFNILQSLNTIVTEKNENEANPNLEISVDDDAFDELDLILNNKIALNKKYKTGHKIEIALTKQNHALMDQIKDFEGHGGFWDKKYVPLFKWIAENNHFENFIYTLCYPIENEKYAKIIKNNEKNIADFLTIFYKKWLDILSNNTVEFEGEMQTVSNYYYNNYTQAVGKTDGETSVGNWFMYNENGQLSSQGTYDDAGERTKKWTWYHQNGVIKETAFYEDTKLNGPNQQFFENGKPYISANYKDGKLEGEYVIYNDNGAIIQKKYFKNGQLDGLYESFFKVGESLLEWHIPYKTGDVESIATEYYSNGDVYAEIPFENGNRQGVEKKYHFNKKIASEVSFVNNELSGPYKTYHSNGNLWKEGISENGFYNGPFKTYYRNGILESDEIYDAGNLNGDNKYYDRDGKLHSVFEYRKGEVLAYKYYDKDGSIIKEARKKGGEFQFTGYTAQGIKFSEGLYDIKGGKEGLWKFYSNNGVLTSEGEYSDNKSIGEHKGYYDSGKIESISQYENDSLTGYYVDYHKNGQLKQQGWYKKNAAHGTWETYYINGTLKERNYYHNGSLNGKQELFTGAGKPERTYTYKLGTLFSEIYFNQDGKVIGDINYRPKENDFTLTYNLDHGKTDLELHYVNGVKHGKYISYDFYGNTKIEGQYNNGEMDGEWTWYFPNGNKSIVKNYRDGTLHGDYLEYYEDGQLDEKELYLRGEEEGTSVAYHENGIQSHATDYENGLLHGKKLFYDNTGKLQLIRFYEYDRLIGYSYLDTNSKELPMIPLENESGQIKALFDNGKTSRAFEYKNGKLHGLYKEYYYSGQLESEMTYISGNYDGVVTNYYANGNTKSTYNYQYGVLQGLGTKYHENGKKKEETSFINGNKNGSKKYFDTNGELTKEEHYFNNDIYKSETF